VNPSIKFDESSLVRYSISPLNNERSFWEKWWLCTKIGETFLYTFRYGDDVTEEDYVIAIYIHSYELLFTGGLKLEELINI